MVLKILDWVKGAIMAKKEMGTLTVHRTGQVAMLVNFMPKAFMAEFSDDPTPVPPPVCEPPCEDEDGLWVDIECLCESTKQYEVKITWQVKTQRTVAWEIDG